ncbi:hypothetical protein E4U19_002577 [Claviceps sp. Clav32 group G5]|nr:hypothetical protein E4U19_002577 [Claviceps sp. Clav32 group G5]
MKRHALAKLALLATASLALAQSLSDLPSCAIPCLNDAIKQTSTCATTDLACICKKFDKIQGAAAGCILGACGKDVALGKVLPVTQQLCAKQGGTGPINIIPQPGNSVSVLPQPVTQPGGHATTATTPMATASLIPTASTGSPVSTAGAAVFGPVGGGLAVLIAGGLALL